jgi:hypothetical protein
MKPSNKFGGCPGQDQSMWHPEDIQFLKCPDCGGEVEIWKDEPVRSCPSCKTLVHNPRAPQDCEKWCASASECPGVILKNKSREPDSGSA